MMRHNIGRKKSPQPFWKNSSMILCNTQTLVILVNFPKESVQGLGEIFEKIRKPYSHDLLCDNFFKEKSSMMTCNIQTKTMLVNFAKKFPFDTFATELLSAVFPQDGRTLHHGHLYHNFFLILQASKNIFLAMVCVTNNDKYIRQSSCRILCCLTGWKTDIFVNKYIRFLYLTKVR